jgi:glycosyltransferase involved in cell wall biosynthesis
VKFSILIPTIPHRHERLCPLLAELDRQMLPDAEVLLYRDNLQATYGEKNQRLLDMSDGDYIAFMDDDDWISPNYIRLILAALETSPDTVGFPEFRMVDGKHQETFLYSMHDHSAEFPGAEPGGVLGSISQRCPIRRDLARLGRWRGGYGADASWAFKVQASGRVHTEAWIPEPLYYYQRRTADSFLTPRRPFPEPLPDLPSYRWLHAI